MYEKCTQIVQIPFRGGTLSLLAVMPAEGPNAMLVRCAGSDVLKLMDL